MLFFAAGVGAVFTLFLMICMEACTLQKSCKLRTRRTIPCHALLTKSLFCLSEAIGGLPLDVLVDWGAADYSIQKDES